MPNKDQIKKAVEAVRRAHESAGREHACRSIRDAGRLRSQSQGDG